MAKRKHRITRPPYQCVYWKEYLADTTHLTPLARAAYVQLWAIYWNQGGPHPDDDGVLASIAGLDLDAWMEVRPTVQPLFRIVPVTTAARRGAMLPSKWFGEDAGRVIGKDTPCWFHVRINSDMKEAIDAAIRLSRRNRQNRTGQIEQ